MRVSNFLLWQIAYAEIWVTETLWPDFRRRDLLEAIARVPEARSPLRRHQAVAGGARRQVTRVLQRRRPARPRRRRRLVRAGVAVPDRRRALLVLACRRVRGARARASASPMPGRVRRGGRRSPARAFSRARRGRRSSGCRSTSVLLSALVAIGAIALTSWRGGARCAGARGRGAVPGALSRAADRRDGGDSRDARAARRCSC